MFHQYTEFGLLYTTFQGFQLVQEFPVALLPTKSRSKSICSITQADQDVHKLEKVSVDMSNEKYDWIEPK